MLVTTKKIYAVRTPGISLHGTVYCESEAELEALISEDPGVLFQVRVFEHKYTETRKARLVIETISEAVPDEAA